MAFLRKLRLEGALVLGATLLLPWAHGGVELWAYRGASFLLATAAAVALARGGFAGLALDRQALWLLPAGLLALWGAVQLVPLAPGVLRTLSPAAAAAAAEGIPGWPAPGSDPVRALLEDARAAVPEAPRTADRPSLVPAGAAQPERWRPLSLHPAATAERLAWYVSLLCAFLVVRARTASAGRADAWRGMLLGLAGGLAVFGLAQALLTPGQIYGRTLERVRPFGPYVNPSHFSGVMELLVPWSAAYAWSRFRMGSRARAKALAASAVAAVGLVACLAAASRTGTALLAAALLVLAVVASRGRRLLAIGGALVLLAGVVTAALAWGTLGDRVRDSMLAGEQDLSIASRVVVLRSLGEMMADHPVFGTGFGTFRVVFPRYLPRGEAELWNQAHDDWAEMAVEGGLVALALTGWLTLAYWRRALSVRAASPSRGFRLTRLGLLLGLTALTVHALVDFNHQIPANALLFVVASAIALAPDQEEARP